ncbi:MAG: LysR family transcriptional regulator [Proteobacteria bacterium]|nr:LysR family transcriptional regulator [Pseudomonadota bacterium]
MLDRLTLDQLRTLIAVAETGSFSAAGRRLTRVQSGVSQTIQSLESTLGIALFAREGKTPVLTDAGKVILNDARRLVDGAEALRARAEQIASDVEPELTLAVDPMFPGALVRESLKALAARFPCLPVTLFTEALGGAEQRLRDGTARLGIFTTVGRALQGLTVDELPPITLVPVAAPDHALAREKGPISKEMLEAQVQLVLTDRTQITAGFSGGVISHRVWRFADLATRLDYLLAGFGWCNMPLHMVEEHIAAGRLVHLPLADDQTLDLPIAVVYSTKHPPGRAGRWLLDDIRPRLAACPERFSGKAAAPKRAKSKRGS